MSYPHCYLPLCAYQGCYVWNVLDIRITHGWFGNNLFHLHFNGMSEERGRPDRRIRTDRRKYDRQTESEQTDADRTGRRNRIKQTQTEVRQADNIRLRWTSKDTDKTTTEQQRSQFAVVEDDEQLIVDNLSATSNTNTTMPAADIDDSPLMMTRTWEEVFGSLDQWDVVDKLRALHLKLSTNTSSTGFLQFKSPDIAHLVANTSRRVRLSVPPFPPRRGRRTQRRNGRTVGAHGQRSHGRRHGGQQEPRERTPARDNF